MKYVSVTAGDCYDIAMEAAAAMTWPRPSPGATDHPSSRTDMDGNYEWYDLTNLMNVRLSIVSLADLRSRWSVGI